MLYERKQISELLYMKHFHDDNRDYIKYDDILLDKTLSPYLYKNNIMNNYLKMLQPLVSIMIDHMNIIKNLKNYMVDKNNYKQLG